jgi:hypothetical protein
LILISGQVLSLPVNYKIESSAETAKGIGYYPDVNLYIIICLNMVLGINKLCCIWEYKTKGVLMSTFELGFTFEMGEKNALYAAMFLDSGYGSIIDQNKTSLIKL